jgi:hypothetical protein
MIQSLFVGIRFDFMKEYGLFIYFSLLFVEQK